MAYVFMPFHSLLSRVNPISSRKSVFSVHVAKLTSIISLGHRPPLFPSLTYVPENVMGNRDIAHNTHRVPVDLYKIWSRHQLPSMLLDMEHNLLLVTGGFMFCWKQSISGLLVHPSKQCHQPQLYVHVLLKTFKICDASTRIQSIPSFTISLLVLIPAAELCTLVRTIPLL